MSINRDVTAVVMDPRESKPIPFFLYIIIPPRRELPPITRSTSRGRGRPRQSRSDSIEEESAASSFRAVSTAESTDIPVPLLPPVATLGVQAGPIPPAVSPVTALVPPPPIPPETPNVFISKKLKEARQLGYVSFTGELDVIVARDWIIQVSETLTYMGLDDEMKLKVATRLFEKRARTLWNSVKSRSPLPLTWMNFLLEFDVTGKESYKEVVQMALWAEKLATENRWTLAEFAKRRNPPTFLSQSSKRGRDSTSTVGSTTSASVASTRPPSQQSQPRSSRFDRPMMSRQGGTSRGLDRCRNCGGFHVGSCRKLVTCFQCGQQGHIKRVCPQLRWGTVTTFTLPTRLSILRTDTSRSQSRQGSVIRSGMGSNTPE
ncbi:zinc finger protein [Theobroma cacao]|nr:zinc finger protein [Theobroma cacao]